MLSGTGQKVFLIPTLGPCQQTGLIHLHWVSELSGSTYS